MSLHFNELVEIADDRGKDKITFILKRVLNIPGIDEDDLNSTILITDSFRTSFGVKSLKWDITIVENMIKIRYDERNLNMNNILMNGSCNISYKLFSDEEMCSEIYSSERISLTFEPEMDAFRTSKGMMEYYVSVIQRKVATVVVFIELELPAKFFFRPFEIPGFGASRKYCENYPEDIASDFRFEFLTDGDFNVKCLDGNVSALKMVLNISPSILKKFVNTTNNDEINVEHSVDVVKPIITYIHSRCFRMPETYTLDYADRLLKAIHFFQLKIGQSTKREIAIYESMIHEVYYSMCEKFVQDDHDFETILQWISIVSHYSWTRYHYLHILEEMINVVIAEIYFNEFRETFQNFSKNATPDQKQMRRNVFGSVKRALQNFKEIQNIFHYSFFTKKISYLQ